MNRPKIYITRLIPQSGIDMLNAMCDVAINPHDRPLTRQELLQNITGRDGIITMLNDKVDAEFLDAAAGVKGVANFAVGFDNMDVKEATKRGIPLSNTPGVLTNATAEMAWALLFAICRRVVESDAVMRSGQWPGWAPLQFIGGDVTGKTLGIVGAGRIGTAMAMKSRGFDMPVIYTGIRRNEKLEHELGAKKVELNELLAASDFISLHVPLLPETRHLFGAAQFKMMKQTAYLINTSRGPVINEAELVDALKNGEIAGAGLDVYEFEPKMADGLKDLKNVVVAPHTGSASVASRESMSLLVAENILAMVAGAPAPTCLNPEIYRQ